MTFAFTVAGAALGYSLHASPEFLVTVVGVVACVGGAAALVCRQDH